MSEFIKIHKKRLILYSILLLGLVIRLILSGYGNDKGDILDFAEWGEMFWLKDLRTFYQDREWYYSFPTYPPISNLMYAGAYWLNERRYILAEIHNTVKIIPSSFIVYFGKPDLRNPFMYNTGYFLLMKFPTILADIGIGLFIYKVVYQITKNFNKSVIATSLFIFNPVTIFISAVWGQTEGLISLFGLASFYLLYKKKFWLSAPLLFISLYTKPTWAVLIPLYLFMVYLYRPKVSHFIYGVAISLALYILTTYPFSGFDFLPFTKDVIVNNMLPTAKGSAKATISAFNLYSVFFELDRTLPTRKVLLQLDTIGYIVYFALNLFTFKYLLNNKKRLVNVFAAIFFVGFGSYLFLTNLLDRYFFASFAPMIILMFTDPKTLIYGVIINVGVFANLFYAFFRRSIGPVEDVFTANNFLLIRMFSLVNLTGWLLFVKKLNFLNPSGVVRLVSKVNSSMLQFMRGES